MSRLLKRLFFLIIFILLVCEIIVRFTIGRGNKFYILRDVSFMHFEKIEKLNKKIDIFCVGCSASQGLCLENLADRYSERLAGMLPGYCVLNKSGVGIPLSEVNYYLYGMLKANDIKTCIIFAGNNEYLERLNRKHHPDRLKYFSSYYTPKLFSLISNLSYLSHNIFNIIIDKIGKYDPYAHICAGLMNHEAQDWNNLSRYDVILQNLIFRMRLYELKSIIKSNPKVFFIYVIPAINYHHVRKLVLKESGCDLNIDSKPSREILRKDVERRWIKQRHTISPALQNIIKGNLKNLGNLVVLDFDEVLFPYMADERGGYDPSRFFIDYCHLNKAGHSLLALELNKIIETHYCSVKTVNHGYK